ncbi:hypothetical protein F9K33_16330 [bacterium]|nr:MAG: hypothetical protein F9K33_16330 [bacterium]
MKTLLLSFYLFLFALGCSDQKSLEENNIGNLVITVPDDNTTLFRGQPAQIQAQIQLKNTTELVILLQLRDLDSDYLFSMTMSTIEASDEVDRSIGAGFNISNAAPLGNNYRLSLFYKEPEATLPIGGDSIIVKVQLY